MWGPAEACCVPVAILLMLCFLHGAHVSQTALLALYRVPPPTPPLSPSTDSVPPAGGAWLLRSPRSPPRHLQPGPYPLDRMLELARNPGPQFSQCFRTQGQQP